MAPALIIFVGFLYVVVGVDLWLHDKHGLALAFLGYAFSNAGLYLAQAN